MFAVRGWAVPSAALKRQTNVPKESATESPGNGEETALKPETSRKRKRKGSDSSARGSLLSGDLSSLWQEHIEHKPESKGQSTPHEKTKKEPTVRNARASGSQSDRRNDNVLELNGATPESSRARKDKKKALKAESNSAPTASSLRKKENDQSGEQNGHTTPRPIEKKPAPPSGSTAPDPKLTTLQTTMQQKLISSRFRHLNESLYTNPSAASMELFRTNPQFFQEYHDGFRRQVEAWPENPRDTFLAWIRRRGALDIEHPAGGQPRIRWKYRKQVQQEERREHRQHQQDEDAYQPVSSSTFVVSSSERDVLPRDPHNGICTIADLGCGEGQLGLALISTPSAKSPKKQKKQKEGMLPLTKQLRLYVYSYDLAASERTPHVAACDVRALPLASESVDVAIFCLALMGTNWLEFIEEAYRVLRWRGECWISEVGSRFDAAAARRAEANKRLPVEHSVGLRRNKVPPTNKNKSKKGKSNKSENRNDRDDDQDQILLDQEDAPQQSTTDVSAFVAVLRRRGFQLAGSPEVTGGDKATGMFVRMRFIKCLHPIKGKGVPSSSGSGSGGNGKLAFIDEKAGEITDVLEAAVLKPCVYKIR